MWAELSQIKIHARESFCTCVCKISGGGVNFSRGGGQLFPGGGDPPPPGKFVHKNVESVWIARNFFNTRESACFSTSYKLRHNTFINEAHMSQAEPLNAFGGIHELLRS